METFGAINATHMIFVWIDVDEVKRKQEMSGVEGAEYALEHLGVTTNTQVIFQVRGEVSSIDVWSVRKRDCHGQWSDGCGIQQNCS